MGSEIRNNGTRSRRNQIRTSKNPFDITPNRRTPVSFQNPPRPPSSIATTVVIRRLNSAHTVDQKSRNLAKVNAKITKVKPRSKSDSEQDRRITVRESRRKSTAAENPR